MVWSDPRTLDRLRHEDKKRKCPECGGTEIAHERGELVCKKCGLVID